MAQSVISAIALQRNSSIDNEMFRNNSNAVKLDVVAGANQNGGSVNQQNSLSKIAKFNPTQLKNFSSNIGKNLARNKQTSQVRDAQQNLVKEKIQAMKAQNPFSNKAPVEARGGSKINFST